ncbi:MAG: hypothetical protein QG608_168 [Actinomycetota bacterium]|nr:hypothetical protein [Actinomycetota bacterium]
MVPTDRPGTPVRVAVISGKGGTGKTTVATSLARVLAEGSGAPVTFADCDVEAPNGHLFLGPRIETEHEVLVPRARIDREKCIGCGDCVPICRFAAILPVPGGATVLPDLCHGCGACVRHCPQTALHEIEQLIGTVLVGSSGALRTVEGRTEVGQEESPEVIKAVLGRLPGNGWAILDGPPGTACPFTATLSGADVVLLVVEPTPCGLHDLDLAVEVVREIGLPHAAVLNRAGAGDDDVRSHCERAGIELLLEIPHSRRIARACAVGELLVETEPSLAPALLQVASRLAEIAGAGASSRPVLREGRGPGTVPVPWSEPDLRPSALVAAARAVGPGLDVGSGHDRAPELIVLSGKGGTGKTTVTASLAYLAHLADPVRCPRTLTGGADRVLPPGGRGDGEAGQGGARARIVLADADVDASNLHLLLPGRPGGRWLFVGGQSASIDPALCEGCGACLDACRFDALRESCEPGGPVTVDTIACEGCGVCVDLCPSGAACLFDDPCGEWGLSETGIGPMVHARLRPGRHNSGKLVSLVRGQAADLGRVRGSDLLIGDGPPGIGCPATSAATGADRVLLVTEPTRSGLHDLRRIADLTARLGVRTAVCLNKVDLSPRMAEELLAEVTRRGLPVLGTVRYDEAVRRAHLDRTCVVEHAPDSHAAQDIRDLWTQVLRWIENEEKP